METFPLMDANGELFAFEVGNTLVGPGTIARIMRTKLDASIAGGPYRFSSKDDVRLRFLIQGAAFQVFEPFGDNSRYWIGPDNAEPRRHVLIDAIHEAMRAYDTNPISRLLTALRGRPAA